MPFKISTRIDRRRRSYKRLSTIVVDYFHACSCTVFHMNVLFMEKPKLLLFLHSTFIFRIAPLITAVPREITRAASDVGKVSGIFAFFLRRFAVLTVLAIKKIMLGSEFNYAPIDVKIVGVQRTKNSSSKRECERVLKLVGVGERKFLPDNPS